MDRHRHPHRASHLRDWNVVVSVRERGFVRACELLGELGPVSRTECYNVLVMRVHDPHRFLEDLRGLVAEVPDAHAVLGRVIPLTATFTFQSPAQFEAETERIVRGWLPELAGKTFHVRVRSRGAKGRVSSQHEERRLGEIIVQASSAQGRRARVSFDDPEVIIAVETVGDRAGLSLWRREDRQRYPFLKLN